MSYENRQVYDNQTKLVKLKSRNNFNFNFLIIRICPASIQNLIQEIDLYNEIR